jgi:hypothetical protein
VRKCRKSDSAATMTYGTATTRVPLDAHAHREGYLAGRRALSDQLNPYHDGTREALAWAIGHVDGRTKRLRMIRGGRPSGKPGHVGR